MIASAPFKAALAAFSVLVLGVGLVSAEEGVQARKPPTLEVRGVVVDEQGAPVAGAEVRSDPFGLVETTGVTGEDGAFAFPSYRGPLNRRPLLARTADGRKVGVLDSAFYSTPAGADAPVRIVVRPGREVTVRVVDANKAPVAGAAVDVVGRVVGSKYDMPFALAHATTGADGSARLLVPIDPEVVWVVGQKGGRGFDFAEFATYGQSVYQVTGGTTVAKLPDSIALTLDAPRTVRIKAVDRNDRPVVGLEFFLNGVSKLDRRGSVMYSSQIYLAKTDRDGIATFDWLPQSESRDPLLIMPLSTSGDYAHRRVYLKEGEDEATYRVDPLETIRGRVTLPDGSPAKDVQVVARGTGRRMDRGSGQVRTGDDGSYEMKVAPDEGYVVYVEDDKWAAPTRLDVGVRAGKPVDGVDFQVTTGTQIHGTVVDLDGLPVPDAHILLHQKGGEVPADFRDPDDGRPRTFHRQLSATSDAQGRYAFHVGPGEYTYVARDRSTATTEVKLTVGDEPEVVHDYRISRRPVSRAPFTGRVVAASDGKPIVGATVAIVDGEDVGEHTFPLRTDADGRFQTVRAAHHGYIEASSLDGALAAVVEIGPDANDVVVPLAPAASARGVLLDEESQPVANLTLFTMNRQKTWKDGKPSDSTRSYSNRPFTTDGEGRFTLTGLVVGQDYTIVAMINRSESRDVGVIAPHAPGPIDAVTLRIGYDNPRLPENLVVFRNESPDVGKVLPEFTATTLDGKPLSLKDFAGKYVLLDFWATWCGPCLEEIPRIQDVHDAFARDDRFTILSLSVDKTIGLPRAFQEKRKFPWPQGYIGTGPHGFGTGLLGFQPGAFAIPSIPTYVLVGPDGKVVARGMRGPFIMKTVEKALEQPN